MLRFCAQREVGTNISFTCGFSRDAVVRRAATVVFYVVCYGVHLCAEVFPGSLPDGVLKQRDDRDGRRRRAGKHGEGRPAR